MRCFVPVLAALALLGAPASAAEPQPLFNGRNFDGWKFTTTPGTGVVNIGKVQADGVIAATGLPVGFLATTTTHANYRLHVEWRWPGKPGNGGVLLHISPGPMDRAWPLSFQVQTKHQAAGDLLPMAGSTFAEPLTSAPGAATAIKAHTAADSERPAGEWNTCDITCRDDTIEVVINGVLQNRATGLSLREGKIGFQFEGVPFELRGVTVVGLD